MSTRVRQAFQSAAGAAAGSEILPEGVTIGRDATGYISSTSLSGTSSSATYTFSCWFYYVGGSSSVHLFRVKDSSNNYFEVRINAGYDSSQSLDCRFSGNKLAFYNNDSLLGGGLDFGWNHLVISINNNQNSSAKAYLNDQNLSLTHWANAGYTAYNFNQISIGSNFGEGNPLRMAHAYIDYTYRDLSVTSQRRNFITADLKPATGQASLNPVVYLPLTDTSVATTNEGTGGNFTITGTIDNAQRGPNQFNSVASFFDSSSHYLNRTASLSGASASQQITCSMQFRVDSDEWDPSELLSFNKINDVNNRGIEVNFDGRNGYLQINCTDTSGNYIFMIGQITDARKIIRGKMYTLSWCADTTNNSSVHVYLNGEEITSLTNHLHPNMSSQYIDFVGGGKVAIGARFDGGSGKHHGSIGEVYLDNTYTDLSTDNIFWDSEANRGKSVQQVLDETGNTPLIAMPILSNDPGNNLGTGGDFTAQGGSRLGLGDRPGSEFWSHGLYTAGGWISRTGLGGSTSEQYLTMVIAYDASGQNGGIFGGSNSSTSSRINVDPVKNTGYFISITDANGGYDVIESTTPYGFYSGWQVLLMSFDISNTSKRHVYRDHTRMDANMPWEKYVTSRRFDLSSGLTFYVGRDQATNSTAIHSSMVYVDNSYIDFSNAANRLKFIDQFGYPKDLTPSIEDGSLANPLVYLKFDDPDNLGINSGTAGNFTESGFSYQINSGSDFYKS